MSNTRNFVYSEDDSSDGEEEKSRQNRDDSSSDGSASEESSDDEPEDQESSSGESSQEDEEDREDEMREHIEAMLTSLKDHYDQMMQGKLRDIESKKNTEIEEFRRQEKAFTEEMGALKAERGANVEIIEELRRELAEQRLTFEQILENILENQ